jgi:mRNA interferase RelE/StbE
MVNLLNKYRIFETDNFLKCLKKINKQNRPFIEGKIRKTIYKQLEIEPHFGNNIKKLRNWKPETWRYRIGDFRLFYEIDDREFIVSIITIDNRKNAY